MPKQIQPRHFTKTQEINLHVVPCYITYCYARGITKATSPLNTPHTQINSSPTSPTILLPLLKLRDGISGLYFDAAGRSSLLERLQYATSQYRDSRGAFV